MGRQIDADDLVSTVEIAERVGLSSHKVVHDWVRRHVDFPQPVADLAVGKVWNWPDVEAWARATGRL